MDIREVTIERQIEFNNQWPKIDRLKLEAEKTFEEKLNENGYTQLFVPIQWNNEKAFTLFSNNPAIAKIFSSTLDAYDVLPYNPDIAFDVIWRTLEISMKFLSINSWRYAANTSLEEVIRKTCTDIISPLANQEEKIKELMEKLLEKISLVSLRYLVARLYFKMDLSVCPQVEFVKKRANEILGGEVLDAIKNKYIDSNGNIEAKNQRKAARLLRLILKGQQVDIDGTVVKPLQLSERVELYVSCVIYSSRCERFHGDYYSPLKSSLTDLSTYYEYYYLLTFSYALWGIVMHKIQQVVGDDVALSVSSLCSAINGTLERLAVLPNK